MPESLASKPSTGADCGDVERLALRDAFDDVEQDDIAEFLEADEMGERAADLAGADERNLVARHGENLWEMPRSAAARWLSCPAVRQDGACATHGQCR